MQQLVVLKKPDIQRIFLNIHGFAMPYHDWHACCIEGVSC
jgi:hypothetical protein